MSNMQYDGTFAGFLTAVYEVYERKLDRIQLTRPQHSLPTLWSSFQVISDKEKAERVWSGLKKKLSTSGLKNIYWSFLSELPHAEDMLISYIRHVFESKQNVEDDFGFEPALYVQQTARQVHREKHRMEAFVRFQRLSDDLYMSVVEPDYNVLPLIASHFANRYADQQWLIYDMKRKYGIHYDLADARVSEVEIEAASVPQLNDSSFLVHEEEPHYQTLWKKYFDSVNIKARKNLKLHIRHVPLRYWKHLTEKH